jgi:hypothetical protein
MTTYFSFDIILINSLVFNKKTGECFFCKVGKIFLLTGEDRVESWGRPQLLFFFSRDSFEKAKEDRMKFFPEIVRKSGWRCANCQGNSAKGKSNSR